MYGFKCSVRSIGAHRFYCVSLLLHYIALGRFKEDATNSHGVWEQFADIVDLFFVLHVACFILNCVDLY